VRSTLELTQEEMREFGYRVIDFLVEHYSTLREQRVASKRDPQALWAKLMEPPPEEGAAFETILERLKSDVFENMARVNHPRFFGFVPSSSNFAGALGDALASGLNVFEGTWLSGSGPATIELVLIEWLRQCFGFAEGLAGVFVSGGSIANLTALSIARRVRAGNDLGSAIAYFSDQTHSSVERALQVLGLRPSQMRKIPSDDHFRLPVAELERQVERDRQAGLRPFCVVANAGTTNTGAVDPLVEIAKLCRVHELWLHGDGAYGAAAVLCEQGRAKLVGLPLVDSLTLDPHKWLFQPIACGCVLVREGHLLQETFRIHPEYLQDVHREQQEVHFCDRGIELTRGFRALKLWLSIQVFGMNSFRAAIARGIELAEVAERRLRASGEWEIVTPAQLAMVTFRHVRSSRDLVSAIYDDGYALLTSTSLRGRPALRLCTLNPRTTDEEIHRTIEKLEQLAKE
jgi:glutamate/tyrosine decarboxylase-like PLP-dependent enzyme